jgi:hypothetical protein
MAIQEARRQWRIAACADSSRITTVKNAGRLVLNLPTEVFLDHPPFSTV